MCNKIANHFHNDPIVTRESIPLANNPVTNRRIVEHSMYFRPADHREINKIIMAFKNKKSSLLDLPVKLLKFLSNKISPVISDIFNYCFESSAYPSSFKIARVVPVHKGGNKEDVKNYRPISILSSLNKIFEKLIHSRINLFLDANNIINNAQYGFIKRKSTTHATYEVLSKILPAFTMKKFTMCILCMVTPGR